MRTLATFALLLVLGAPPARAGERSVSEANRVQAKWRLRELARAFRGKTLCGLSSFHNGASAAVHAAKDDAGRDIVIREVPDVDEAVKFHNAMYLLAAEAGAPHLVLPAAKLSLRADQQGVVRHDVMITELATPELKPANNAPEGLAHISEPDRVSAALLDFLTGQQDRQEKNILVSSTGKTVLIDHDYSLGMKNPWNQTHRSRFFPGRAAAFRSTQASVADLSAPAREMLERMVTTRARRLAKRYGISEDQARYMRARAQLVVEHGLTAAIEAAPL